ncbi:FAD:protein FMN transferase [Mucilaginibacter sp. FT3.2]|uniref:FAD:protein FMN transferase n=1 Tax=Mucilaginibacter sp. FT3.2 TaxID=2723090 RepID=UPI0016201C41|nr:FAD:protein FMN transferase [Mucilaginibacter sp. FT3.2]MBB6230722.1 thiamine biosynthesis lipoprotein [Mucilaginibacter sp. FT3.2]
MLAVKTLSNNLTTYRRNVHAMGDKFEISVVGNDALLANEQINIAIDEINRVEKLLSAFGDDSNIKQINRNAGIEPTRANGEIFRLISRALQISELTHGAFDITYFTGNTDNDNALVENSPVKTAPYSIMQTNYQNVVLDETKQTIFLKEKGMRIGFGANSKGYAADRAKYILQMNGVSSGVINSGGDLLTWGTQPNLKPWTVAAADPDQRKQPFAHLNISNMAFATSINAEKYASVGKKKFQSIDAAKKGFPVSEIKSVSIMSPTAELADAMASPIINIGVNAGMYLINQLNQIACIIVDDQNRVYTSKGVNI